MRLYLKTGVALIILLTVLMNSGCRSMKNRPSKAVQKTEERQKEQEEEKREEYEEAKERHISIQSKDTKEDMEDMQKKSKRYNQNKQKFFLIRWWENIVHKLKKRKPRPAGH
ncbi:MAG: hypothetical protein ACOCPM_00880 [Bacteroidales bacterium]